jgi:glycosyltransferase involved in cell wall biosynthesis
MDVTVALDARYQLAADGSVWSQAGMARPFWERYLAAFDRVRVVARVVPVERRPEPALQVDGGGVIVHGIPDYHGAWQCLRRYLPIRAAVRHAAPANGAVILRVGGQIANLLESKLTAGNHPYGLEVVGDPYEVFAPGVVDHPLRPFLRWHFSRRMRQQCLRAVGVAYVTKRTLQLRYPARFMDVSVSDVEMPEEAIVRGVAWTHYSSIELAPGGIADRLRRPKQRGPFHIVTVGSLAQRYKGTDVLIDALARCVRRGVDVTATVVGDGMYRAALIAQAERAGLGTRVEFAGQVPAGEGVRRILDCADLFVLPSRTEGLPRALIEAMARALPCLASAVGGIPEVLPESDLAPPGDAVRLAEKIGAVLADPARRDAMSQRNLKKALEFRDSEVAGRRLQFYRHVREATKAWEGEVRGGF